MKKTISTIGIAAIAMTMFFNTSISNKNDTDVNSINLNFIANAFAQSGDQDGGSSNWRSRKEMGSKTIVTGTELKVISVGPTGGQIIVVVNIYGDIDCCMSSNEDTACDYSKQDSRC